MPVLVGNRDCGKEDSGRLGGNGATKGAFGLVCSINRQRGKRKMEDVFHSYCAINFSGQGNCSVMQCKLVFGGWLAGGMSSRGS